MQLGGIKNVRLSRQSINYQQLFGNAINRIFDWANPANQRFVQCNRAESRQHCETRTNQAVKYLSNEYKAYINSAGWKKSLRRRIALNLLFGQDVVFPLLKAHDIEHLSYKRIDFNHCEGYEIPFLDLLPLNRVVHRQIVTPVKDILRWLRLAEGNAIWQKDWKRDRCKLPQILPVVLVCDLSESAVSTAALTSLIKTAPTLHSRGGLLS